MRIFKKILCALLAIFIVERIFTFILEPVTYNHFMQMDERQMEADGGNPELVFFGDSRCMRTFVPDVFEQELEALDGHTSVCMNAGVNQQHIISTYYYMKDYFERYDVKYAVVNLNYDYLLHLTEEPVVVKGLTVDRIKTPKVLLEYVQNNMIVNDYPDLLVSYRYRHRFNECWEDVATKLQKEYWQGIDVNEEIAYVENGYATWDLAYKQGNIGTPVNCNVWSKETIDYEALSYIEKMDALCKEYGVELIFVESPISVSRMYAIDGYADFHKQISEICASLEVPFWNLNLLKEENVSIDDTLFSDTEHLNDDGAKQTSADMAKLLKQYFYEKKDVDSYFYNTFEEFDEAYGRIGSCDLEVWEWPRQHDEIPLEEVRNAGIDIDGYMEHYASFLNEESDEAAFYVMRATSFASETIDVNYQFSYAECNEEILENGLKWVNQLEYQVLRPYHTGQYFLVEQVDLPECVAFRLDTCPVEGEDVNHCYRTTID